MPAALKKRPKTTPISEDVEHIHLHYFLTLGKPLPRQAYKSSAWRADFAITFGKPDYRRQAWAQLRDTLRDALPREAFEVMDEHFTRGSARRFVEAFTHDQRTRLQTIITHGRAA